MSTASTTTTDVPMVTLTIDGTQVRVPKGTNLIEAARAAGVEIPYYCYHPDLSIAGNCRMCQVQVKGQPKLTIGCNTAATEGMEVLTHLTSKEVADAQAATLEFILINHPLDCTVCDQAGHCKLQDYHYDYNAKPSRFMEEKEHKVKAEPLGPTVILDGERCIMCTRCIRFCDEVTGTSEIGMLNRGDRSVIAVSPDRPLANPLSGTVVDLCPVGALTHREWRFNTRIWFTRQSESICPGCSTGCNAKVAVRDREVVHVKGRHNPDVNKEWMCDEGRYGFHRFLPAHRLNRPLVNGKESSIDDALKAAHKAGYGKSLVLVAPDLMLEDYAWIKKFVDQSAKQATVAMNYRERTLTEVEAVLISPDYAPNFRGAEFAGLVAGELTKGYEEALTRVRGGEFTHVILVGDRAIADQDRDDALLAALTKCNTTAILCDAESPLVSLAKVVLPGRSILEKSGMMINRRYRLQYSEKAIDFPLGTEPEWRLFQKWGAVAGKKISDASSDRDASLALIKSDSRLSGLRLSAIKAGGVPLEQSPSI